MLGALFGLSPIGKPERDRLFARLLDDSLWRAFEKPPKPRVAKAPSAAKTTAARKRA
jgi:hypothetical protein